MTTRQVIPQMKYYADAADYNNPGSFTSMIQMKSRLETLEEATKRTIYEEELEKKRNSINKDIIYYVDKDDYKNPGTFTTDPESEVKSITGIKKNIKDNSAVIN